MPTNRTPSQQVTITYTGISLMVALAFLAAATWKGTYNDVARFGGTAWVFLLSMIVTMPLVTSWYKKGRKQQGTESSKPEG